MDCFVPLVLFNNIFWFIGFKKSVVFSRTISEDDEDEDSDVFADEPNEVDPDELELAFDNFLDKLEGLVSKRRQNGFRAGIALWMLAKATWYSIDKRLRA